MKFNPLICLGAAAAALALSSLTSQSAVMAMPAAALERAAAITQPDLQQVRAVARGGGGYRGGAVHRGGAVRGGAVAYRGGAAVRRGAVVGGAYVGSGYYGSTCDPTYQYCGGGTYYGGGVYRGGAAVVRGGAVARGGVARGAHVAHRGGARRR
jgi:hypothetical protein